MHDLDIQASVIMPAYNAEKTVERAIASALVQTEPRCEILVIDDASTDATAEIVAGIAGAAARVHLLRNETNLGPAGARNRGLAAARGQWIALLDADDEYEPHRIETLIGLGNHLCAEIVADNLLICTEDGSAPSTPMLSMQALPGGKWLSAAEFVTGNVGSRWAPRISYGFLQPIIRREFILTRGLQYDERNRFGEDFLLYTACLLKGARWWLTPEPMYRYKVRSGTLTDVQSAADLQRIRSMEEMLLRDASLTATDPDLVRALRRHKAVIDRFYYYRSFADAMKARIVSQALGILFGSVTSFRLIALEGMLRAPRITAKALRGGYRW